MAKGYWVACYREINDAEALENYSTLATAAIEGAGGRFPLAWTSRSCT